ncbi:hypothetical protein [Bathymodiolus thermophilus thioautotrophic gill symbiont]|uniref:hypothetical protein n=1 Tax=Bathymodiolus thermophilus thioautotrophic gill symbiont TaxID=2360 RepID=UPI000F07D519|nr:hypothetical protein [Bathymodiolus thermophilus thioautotrophic gill symbiont]
MDLFTPIVEEDKLHNNFKNIILEPEAYARDVINEWADGFIDRDGKFIKEFQTTFNSSFWEIYLYASLKQFNYSIDFTFQAPDFVVNDGGE